MPYSFAPYSFSLLWSVFRLIPRISAARVLLLRVCSRVRRMRPFSASSTVVPIGKLTLSPGVRDILAAHRWPGNARELVNTLERAVVLSSGDVISTEHLPERLAAPGSPGIIALPSISLSLEELERQQIERVLGDSETFEEAAARLGIDPSTLWRKRKRYGLHR